MLANDTIAAISSAVGPAARMIIRLCGPNAFPIASSLTSIDSRAQTTQTTLHFHDLHICATLYLFHSPHSYTTDDLIEFHIPGNPLLARLLLNELLKRGARSAEPGEFTARAFFNGRLDLTAAEGVAATIAAHNQQELSAARQLLSGELSRRLQPLMDRLAQMLALVEVGIDFSEEDVTFISVNQLNADIDDIKHQLQDLYTNSARFERLTHEPTFVLVGRPNAGKSTLLNALAENQRAIVSAQAGTTRDALSAEVALDRGIVRMIDVAGLEESPPTETIASQMHERALRTLQEADFVLLIHDITDPRPLLNLPRKPDLIVHTKSDLLPRSNTDGLAISAQTNHNLNLLRQKLSHLAFGLPTSAPAALALNSRHLQAIDDTLTSLNRAQTALDACGDEVIALELRESLHSLGQILGQLTPDDLLGKIFSTFCIGK